MNVWIDESELADVRKILAEWAKELPENYEPDAIVPGTEHLTQQAFYTVCKRVQNLEIQNKENAKLKLSDFLMGDILWYLIEHNEVKAVLYVNSDQEYDIKTNYSHIHGRGHDGVIIVH